jgi:hypothetical protein
MSFLEPAQKPKKQLDPRAWIIAGAVLLLLAIAYVVWIHRPRASYTARSLSAAHGTTGSLHVEGCHEDFITSPGELIEPRVVPGRSVGQFESVYGSELKHEDSSNFLWDLDGFTLAASRPNEKSDIGSLQISVKGHHIVETLDGVELGLDSFSRILSKMQDKKVEIHERILKDDKNWTFILSLYSACGKNFRSEYTRTLPRDPETDRQITSLPPSAGLDPNLLRSDVFLNKVAYDYSMMLSGGSNQSTQGQPAGHD